MKFVRLVVAVALLFAASSFAQEVKAASSTFKAIPGYTSPPQEVTFYNTGDSELTVTISIRGLFAIPQNLCGGEVKPRSHCAVWVTYTPEAIETDTGSLTFTFNGQTVSVALTGEGIDLIPTKTTMRCEPGTCRANHDGGTEPGFNIKVSAGKGYEIPNGEQVDVSCVEFSGPHRGTAVYGIGTLENGATVVSLQLPYAREMWHCYTTYNGDAEFAPSSAEIHTVW